MKSTPGMKPHGKTPSAGKLELAETCPGSAAYPQIGTIGLPAALGSAKHKFLQHAALNGQFTALDDLDDDATIKEWAELVKVDQMISRIVPWDWQVDELKTEVKFLMEWRTGKSWLVDNWDDRKDHIAGVIDLMALPLVEDDGPPVASDYKTGRQQPMYLSGPGENLQVRTYGKAATDCVDAEEVIVKIVHLDEDGRDRIWKAPMMTVELHGFPAQLRAIMDRVIKARHSVENGELPALVVGEHCTFCPAIDSCPATNAKAVAVLEQKDPIIKRLLKGEKLTNDEIVKTFHSLKVLSKIVDESGKALTRLLDKRGAIPTGDGKEVYIQERSQSRLVSKVFLDALANSGMEPREFFHLMSISKSKINANFGTETSKEILAYMKSNKGIKHAFPSRFASKRKERKPKDADGS